MSRNGVGVYTLPAGNPVVTLTTITSAWANTTLSDIATALTQSLATTGVSSMTGPLKLVDGSAAAPGLAWASETNSGWYRIGGSAFGFSLAGTLSLTVNAGRVWTIAAPSANTALTINGASASPALIVNGAAGAGNSKGILIQSGTNAADYALKIQNQASAFDIFNVAGDTSMSFQRGGALPSLSINASGAVRVDAPSTGATLTLVGTAGFSTLIITPPTNQNAIQLTGTDIVQCLANSAAAANRSSFVFQQAGSTKGAIGADGGQALITGSTNGDFCIVASVGAGAGAFRVSTAAGGGSTQLLISATGTVTIAAPASGDVLAITGRAAGTATFTLNTMANTGAATGTLIANKPGGNANTTKWIPVTCDGAVGYIPVFG